MGNNNAFSPTEILPLWYANIIVNYFGLSIEIRNKGWIATNKDGLVVLFWETKPEVVKDYWTNHNNCYEEELFRISYTGDFRNSLMEIL